MRCLLSSLRAGEKGRMTALEMTDSQALELLRLGLTPGTELLCLRRCPFGGPGIYELRGTVFALRQADAGRIRVCCLTPANGRKGIDSENKKG